MTSPALPKASGPRARTNPSPGRTTASPTRTGTGRKSLAGAVVMVLLGSFMPWLTTSLGSVSGAQGPGIWTFYAAVLGLAGALVPVRALAAAQAGILAVVAIGIPIWQVVHVLGLVGFAGWQPGPGLVLVIGGGALAARAAWLLTRG
ncbi:hypothetical protein [Nocardioides sp. AE5]|uniref:hypothetical protein n=1 Tax=Nocardioides sp. AE5 TaxID=2962573 RepID=UPI0028818CC8|nr:hypothetical protein [Nocardioides sp. AE5]MDT0200541.1 hypothetical protein [Nocardioides sp. AE5]